MQTIFIRTDEIWSKEKNRIQKNKVLKYSIYIDSINRYAYKIDDILLLTNLMQIKNKKVTIFIILQSSILISCSIKNIFIIIFNYYQYIANQINL